MKWVEKLKKIPLSELKFVGFLALYLLILGVLARLLPVKECIAAIEDTGIHFMMCFWLFFIARGLMLFPPIYFLLGSILIYDAVTAIWVFLVGVALSAIVSYWVGRGASHFQWFQKVSERAKSNGLIYNKMRENGYKTVLIINAMGISFDIPNYLAGHFKLRFLLFLPLIVGVNLVTTILFTLVVYPLQNLIVG